MSKRKRNDCLDVDMSMYCIEEDGEPAIYIECDGVRIAKRGHPDSIHARTWVSLEPGWTVRDVGSVMNGELEVVYMPPDAH